MKQVRRSLLLTLVIIVITLVNSITTQGEVEDDFLNVSLGNETSGKEIGEYIRNSTDVFYDKLCLIDKLIVTEKIDNFFNRTNDMISSQLEEITIEEEEYIVSEVSDLKYRHDISVDEMNAIIDRYYKINGTIFKDHGDWFIEAAEQSGLDPVYLFAHAGCESGYGACPIGDKYNYYGIGAFDTDPVGCAFTMGSSPKEGIINGAVWIRRNYYDNGQTTLYAMQYGEKQYSSGQQWVDTIETIMEKSYEVISV